MLAGMDPDFHRGDLADSIESGAYPQWELGVQVFPDTARATNAAAIRRVTQARRSAGAEAASRAVATLSAARRTR